MDLNMTAIHRVGLKIFKIYFYNRKNAFCKLTGRTPHPF